MPDSAETSKTPFKWGEIDGAIFGDRINQAYEEVVYFKKNLFLLPSGSAGKWFVTEKANFFEAMVAHHPMEKVAMKASSVMEHLLLQKAAPDSTSKRNNELLTQRIKLWERGEIDQLLSTAKAIQERLDKGRRSRDPKKLARSFARLMFLGKTRDALNLLEEQSGGGVLPLSRALERKLRALHLEPEKCSEEALITGEVPSIDPATFEPITEDLIKKAALKINGSNGPSGGDAEHWKRMTLSFGYKSRRLREAMANLGKRMCTERMDPTSLEALLANRLIALDRCPGVRPGGIGEAPRRIIGKGITMVLRKDVEEAASVHNLCAHNDRGLRSIVD